MTEFEKMTAEQFVAEFPRARGHEEAVEYLVARRAKSSMFRKVCERAESMAAEGFRVVKCGETNHSRQYSTYRFAVIPA